MTSPTWIQIEIKRNNINRSLTNVSQQRDSAKVIQLLFTLFSVCSNMTSPTWIQIEIKRNNTNRSWTIVKKMTFIICLFTDSKTSEYNEYRIFTRT